MKSLAGTRHQKMVPLTWLMLRRPRLEGLPPCINDEDGVCTMQPVDDMHGPVYSETHIHMRTLYA
jgi:hypothetical protein